MSGIIIRNARVLTMSGPGGLPRRGTAMRELGIIPRADVVIEDGTILAINRPDSGEAPVTCRGPITEIDARGRVLMPGFVDAHTHAMWAGDRLDEWEMKRIGKTYLEILRAGGGIMSTVRAVRAASEAELVSILMRRLDIMLREGTTTVEVKSGYGMNTVDELKMLSAITKAAAKCKQKLVATALLAHALDPEQPKFIERTVTETLDGVHAAYPGITIDAFCEKGAWTVEDCRRLFERAKILGHPFRVHTDQFNHLGMTEWAVENGAVSVDHLEASHPQTLRQIATSRTIGVMLPCAGYHTDGRYADGHQFLEYGGALVIATNVNPGSAPCSSMPMAIALAVRHLGIGTAEALTACTINAAALLGLSDRGHISPGARADVILLRHTDERQLAYEFGGNPVDAVVCGGELVAGG